MMRRTCFAATCLAAAGAAFAIGPSDRDKPPTTTQVMESATPSDWRRPDPANTLYMELPGGRVIIELAPRFAPLHVANIKQLVAEKFFDGLAVVRVQDNFVAQWGDADKTRPTPTALRRIPDETIAPWSKTLPFIKLPDADGYAPETGWIDGFPVGVERKPSGQVWITHCYGVLGVGRDDWPDTGSGAELYVVTGQAPRQLDRNIVTVGRVLRGIELLSSLPRGTGALGFYEKPEQRMPIRSIRLAAEVPAAERSDIEVLRTDTPLFTKYVESRRNRRDSWYLVPAGHTDVCNITIPVR
jgi:peptidylprolyl isomerase